MSYHPFACYTYCLCTMSICNVAAIKYTRLVLYVGKVQFFFYWSLVMKVVISTWCSIIFICTNLTPKLWFLCSVLTIPTFVSPLNNDKQVMDMNRQRQEIWLMFTDSLLFGGPNCINFKTNLWVRFYFKSLIFSINAL